MLVQLRLTRETSPSLPHGMPSIPQTLLILQTVPTVSSRIPFCQDRKESRVSLNSRSWTSGVMRALSSLFSLNSPEEPVVVLWTANEAPKHSLARSQVAFLRLFRAFPCECNGATQLRGMPLSSLNRSQTG